MSVDRPIAVTEHLVETFSNAIAAAFPTLQNVPPAVIAPGNNPKFGDYQCNSAMGIVALIKNSDEVKSGALKKVPSPRDIGLKILEHLSHSPLIAKCDVAGPGFVNIYLDRSYAEIALTSVLVNGVQPPKFPKQRVVVDFSSPNIGNFLLILQTELQCYLLIGSHCSERDARRSFAIDHYRRFDMPSAGVS